MKKQSELDRLSAVSDESNQIGEFIEWLESKGYRFAKWVNHQHTDDCWEWDELVGQKWKNYLCGYNEGENFVPVDFNTNNVLAEYFGIDLNKVEHERRELLESLRG